MKRILYLTFYFEPDLCAGSFRNTPLAYELANQVKGRAEVTIITTIPNRYSTYTAEAKTYEERDNIKIHRIKIPSHQSGFTDQILSFITFYRQANKLARREYYDLVFASSSRLFTAYLGYVLASRLSKPLYLDIRDIFVDTIREVVKNPIAKFFLLPALTHIEKTCFGYANHINLISGGFFPYFNTYKATKSNYTNGIDSEFLNLPGSQQSAEIKTLIYAGNIGQGQGLEKIIPNLAKELSPDKYRLLIVGDGGARSVLEKSLKGRSREVVSIEDPVNREELLKKYLHADYLLVHLNDYRAFHKVLPSKIFELAAFDKPLLAGVAGFAAQFIQSEVPNSFVFDPGDSQALVNFLENEEYKTYERVEFKRLYNRAKINSDMAQSITSYLD